jgi:PIN domain nuclease of toxin-antitoxin system
MEVKEQRYVLDSSAIIALLKGESGIATITKYRGDYLISSVIFAEAAAWFVFSGVSRLEAERLVRSAVDEIAPFEEEDVASLLKFAAAAREHGLSLADMVCLSLAIKEKIPVITSDKAWKKLKLPVEVIVFR